MMRIGQLRWFRLLRKKRFYFSVGIIGLLIWIYGFLQLRQSDASVLDTLHDQIPGVPAAIHYLEDDDRQIRYVVVGERKPSLVVFIHGSPSSMSFWNSMLTDSTLLQKATLMAFDRPGYGYSDFGRAETSVARQAEYIATILSPLRTSYSSILLHGSSYGGTVAARLAMDFPDLVDGLLLQSSSMAAGKETIFDLTYPTSHWSIRWLIPSSLKVANAEKLSHFDELKKMESGWDRIRAATLIFHGSDDWLIFPENAEFAARNLRNASFLVKRFFPGRGHDLMWTERPQLKEGLHFLLTVVQDLATFSHPNQTSEQSAILLHE